MSYLLTTDITDLTLKSFVNDNYLDLTDQALEDLAQTMGINDTSAVAFNAGDIAGTVLVHGGSQTGSSLIVNGFTSATGTVKSGCKIRIAGLDRTYTTMTDAIISGNQATLSIYPTLEESPANDAAITFNKLHGTVKKWMIYYTCKAICLDNCFHNNNEQNPDYDKYYLKLQEYKKQEKEYRESITASMITNVIMDESDLVPMFGRTYRR